MNPLPRIGLSGPVGSGKSTLAAALAQRLGVPLIEEDWRQIDEARARYERGVAERLDPAARGRRLGDWMKSVHDWCETRSGRYAQLPGYVADRWELDALAHWLQVFSPFLPAAEHTFAMRDHFLRAASALRLAVVLPVAAHPVPSTNEAGLRRQPDPTLHMLTYNVCLGLLQQVPTRTLRYAPEPGQSVEKSVADIVALLETLP